MKSLRWIGFFLLSLGIAHAQFVYPRQEYHAHEPGLYTEDPFIVHYRKEFFAVFSGDFVRFEKAYAEIKAMVAKNPRDARALIWLGNGDTVEAGILRVKHRQKEAEGLLKLSRKRMDRAVSLRPKDPNIYMMRAATLYIQGEYWPDALVPKTAWAELRDDCLKFITYLGPKLPHVSVHVRGETYGELGIAYVKLGETAKAREAFAKVVQLDPNTDYAKRAKTEIDKLDLGQSAEVK